MSPKPRTMHFQRGTLPVFGRGLADSLTARDLLQCGHKWLAAFTPFSPTGSASRRAVSIAFFSQVEYCDNLISHRRPPSTKSRNDCWT